MLTIFYGILGKHVIDVTDVCFKKLIRENVILIPPMDLERAVHFGDPLKNVEKKVYIITNELKVLEFNAGFMIDVEC